MEMNLKSNRSISILDNTFCNKKLHRLLNCLFLLLILQCLRHINFEKVTGILDLTRNKHIINGCKYHPCDSDNGSFFTPPFGYVLVFSFVVRRIIRLHGCMSDLHQCRFEVNTGTCNSDGFLLTGRFIVDGR